MCEYTKIFKEATGIIWDSQKYDIHHIDFNHTNNELSNLVLLPKKLHHQFHFKYTRVTSYFPSLISNDFSIWVSNPVNMDYLNSYLETRNLVLKFYTLTVFLISKDIPSTVSHKILESSDFDEIVKIYIGEDKIC